MSKTNVFETRGLARSCLVSPNTFDFCRSAREGRLCANKRSAVKQVVKESNVSKRLTHTFCDSQAGTGCFQSILRVGLQSRNRPFSGCARRRPLATGETGGKRTARAAPSPARGRRWPSRQRGSDEGRAAAGISVAIAAPSPDARFAGATLSHFVGEGSPQPVANCRSSRAETGHSAGSATPGA